MILGEIQIERFLQKTQGCLRGELTTDAKKWILRTPSMVAGLTDHIWTIEELLVHYYFNNAKKGDYPIQS